MSIPLSFKSYSATRKNCTFKLSNSKTVYTPASHTCEIIIRTREFQLCYIGVSCNLVPHTCRVFIHTWLEELHSCLVRTIDFTHFLKVGGIFRFLGFIPPGSRTGVLAYIFSAGLDPLSLKTQSVKRLSRAI